MPASEAFYLLDDREVVLTTARDVACDGGGGALGHPMEYMTLGRAGEVVCKYCGRRYLAMSHPDAARVREHGTAYKPLAA